METIFLNQETLHEWQKNPLQKVMALGYFDGLHAGHCRVIETAKLEAMRQNKRLAVMSFTSHPKFVLSDGKQQVPHLMTLRAKQSKLEQLSVETLYMVDFTKEFASLSPQKFVHDYLINLGVVHAVAGFDFSYGYKGAGHLDRLESDSGGKVTATKVAKVEYAGEKISSTCIRGKLANGLVSEMPHLLGHYYETRGHWNGIELQTNEQCMLPSVGRYETVVKANRNAIRTEIIVQDKGELIFPKRLPVDYIGNVLIEWRQQVLVYEKVAQSI